MTQQVTCSLKCDLLGHILASEASGRPGSAERKAKLLNALGLPPRLSKKELVEALNRLYTFEQLNELQLKILDS